jgi:hypothetical protein
MRRKTFKTDDVGADDVSADDLAHIRAVLRSRAFRKNQKPALTEKELKAIAFLLEEFGRADFIPRADYFRNGDDEEKAYGRIFEQSFKAAVGAVRRELGHDCLSAEIAEISFEPKPAA